MRSFLNAALSILLTGCATLFLQTDGFSKKLDAGCETVDACETLVTEAKDRDGGCKANTVGSLRCEDTREELSRARALLDRRKRLESYKNSDAPIVATPSAADVEKAEQEQAALAKAESARQEKMRNDSDDASYQMAKPSDCGDRGDIEACALLASFCESNKQNRNILVARKVLAQGRLKQDENYWQISRVDACKKAKRLAECEGVKRYLGEWPRGIHEAEARELMRTAEEHLTPAGSQGGGKCGGTVQCCDGTCSPSCTSVRRGCCSHHGGVCN